VAYFFGPPCIIQALSVRNCCLPMIIVLCSSTSDDVADAGCRQGDRDREQLLRLPIDDTVLRHHRRDDAVLALSVP